MGLEKIKELSKIKSISIEELAEISTVPKSTINKIVNGITENPGYKTILLIANALSLSADEFINLLDLDLKELKLNSEEENIIRKYKKLSLRGKGAVTEILEYEYKYESELKKAQQEKEKIVQLKPQIKQELHYLDVIAAHNDNTDEDQVEKMRRDAMALLED